VLYTIRGTGHSQFDIQAALLVIAVAVARVLLPNISTGTAQLSGPIAALNTRLKNHVVATNPRLAWPLATASPGVLPLAPSGP
jgi:hypothetical protein